MGCEGPEPLEPQQGEVHGVHIAQWGRGSVAVCITRWSASLQPPINCLLLPLIEAGALWFNCAMQSTAAVEEGGGLSRGGTACGGH